MLTYSFDLHNQGRVPVTVTGLRPLDRQPRLFEYVDLVDEEGAERFTLGAGDTTRVGLRMRMHGCETLSARAGSFASQVALATTRAGFLDETVVVTLPEEVHTGSPREAFCPEATASSRSPG